MSTETEPTTRAAIIGSTMLLLVGSVLTYIFVLKNFATIWDPQAQLPPVFLAGGGGLLLWYGVRLWPRWRLALGVVWLLLGALAFFNSTQYEPLRNLPEVSAIPTSPIVLRSMTRASILMGCVAVAVGVALLWWQRLSNRQQPATQDAP